jgi:hypothetical protein
MKKQIKAEVELTDTFGGEANYSWVRRKEIEIPKNAKTPQIMRIAKKAIGFSGVRGKTFNHGDFIEFRPSGICQVVFIKINY